MLGITSIDPDRNDLLFERFVSEERREPPTSMWILNTRGARSYSVVYETYGRERAALCSPSLSGKRSVARCRQGARPAEDLTKTLSSQSGAGQASSRSTLKASASTWPTAACGWRSNSPAARRHAAPSLTAPGGSSPRDRLDELVPIEPAAMEDRQVIEFDKDDIDVLKFMKVDVLARDAVLHARAFDLLAVHKDVRLDLATIRQSALCDDPARRYARHLPINPRADGDAAPDQTRTFMTC